MFSSLMDNPTLQVMVYHPINAVWFYLLAASVLQALAVYTWRYRQAPAAMYLFFGVVTRVFWLLALVMITFSPDLTDKIFWAKIQQLSTLVVIPTALLISLHITEQKAAIIRAARMGLLALTAFFCVLILTSDLHDWIWSGIVWDGATFGFIRGPLYWGIIAVGYLALTITLSLYIHRAVITSGLRRWQSIAVPADMMLSMAGHARWVSTQADLIPPLPLGFMLGGLIWFGIFFGLRVFNLQELANATVTHDMHDGLIVIDAQGYIVELNPAARKLFGERTPAIGGSRFSAAFLPWPALIELARSSETRTGEISLGGGHYLCRVTLLTGWGNRSIGKAIILQDIRELKQAQARILDQQKALSIMAERGRLGRELHDGRGQIWNYLNLKLQTVRSFLKAGQPENADMELDKLIKTVKETNLDTRESIIGLKLAADSSDDFIANLQDYLAWYKQSNDIDIKLIMPSGRAEKTINHIREVQLLRIIQEALTNIRKHSGARHVKVSFEEFGQQGVVMIEDDGRGFDRAALPVTQTSFGLQIMAERAEEAGGHLQIESKPGEGTKVIVRFDRESPGSEV